MHECTDYLALHRVRISTVQGKREVKLIRCVAVQCAAHRGGDKSAVRGEQAVCAVEAAGRARAFAVCAAQHTAQAHKQHRTVQRGRDLAAQLPGHGVIVEVLRPVKHYAEPPGHGELEKPPVLSHRIILA